MKLYGVPFSNYYNIVKLALLEKSLAFEEVFCAPSSKPELLQHSPMGKIPYLQDGDQIFSESQAILVYLELSYPTPPLYPRSPIQGARAQQIHQYVDLYLDAPARRLLGAAFFGATARETDVRETAEQLRQGISALGQLVTFDPFIAGPNLTHADLAAVMTLGMIQTLMQRVGGPDPLAHLPGVAAYLDMMAKRPSIERVLKDQQEGLRQLEARLQARPPKS